MQYSVVLFDKTGYSCMTYGPFSTKKEATGLADHIRKVMNGSRRVEVCLHSALRNPHEVR